jgi:hypothetical protein
MEHQRTTATDLPKWSALLIEAVTKPGLIMKAYSAFHTFSVLRDPQHRMLNVNFMTMLIERGSVRRGALFRAPGLT